MSKRGRMFKAQDGWCPICGYRLPPFSEPGTLPGKRITRDHVIPRSRGHDREGNTLLTHKKCNEMKGDRMPTGCELIWLLAVNARMGMEPTTW